MRPLTRTLSAAALSAAVLLGTVGAATAQAPGITTHGQAIAAIDEGQAQVDAGQARIKAGRDWLAANPPISTTPPTSPTTLPPVPGGPNSAAERFGWGAPIAAGSDEFNYTGAPDPAKWATYNGPGHARNGRRVAGRNAVQDGYLRQSGLANGDTAGMASKFGQRFGRWEVRARVASAANAPAGKPYHAVLITWPDSNRWPQGAEYDFLEVNVGDTCATAFLHYPNHQPKVQEQGRKCPVDLTQWHNYGFSWRDGLLVGYLDGQEWFRFTGQVANAPGPMHQTIQLDGFFGTGPYRPANFDVDWARAYTPAP